MADLPPIARGPTEIPGGDTKNVEALEGQKTPTTPEVGHKGMNDVPPRLKKKERQRATKITSSRCDLSRTPRRKT